MKRQNAPSTGKGSADVSLTEESVIICRLKGYITGAVVSDSMQKTQEYAKVARARGDEPKLFLDISGITEQTSEARSGAKKLNTFGLTRVAVCGGGRALTIVGRYIARAAGMGSYTYFFRTEKAAMSWLLSGQKHRDSNEGLSIRLMIGLLVTGISIAVLIGWATDNHALKAWLPGSNSMNPSNAVNFILMAVAIVVLRKGRMSARRKAFAAIVAAWFIVWGGLIILRSAFGWDLPIDRQLFASKLTVSNGVAPNTSLDYILLGGMIFAVLSGMRAMWQRYVFHAFSVLLVITTLGAIVGMSFGLEQLYSGNFVPMAFNTAIVFLILNHALQTVNIPLRFFAATMRALDKYWQPVVVSLVLMMSVGLAWQQSIREKRRTQDTATREEFTRAQTGITDRFDTYINVLRGYKGFFESSDQVDAREYNSYFVNSQPAGGYPGFSAILFVRHVPKAQEAAFVNEMKRQQSIIPGYSKYAVTPVTNHDILYPLTYVGPYTATTSWGFDLGSSETRRIALETARDSGLPASSGEIDLNASRNDPTIAKRTGFFMTIPIYQNAPGQGAPTTLAERRKRIYGFVNTAFENERIFSDIIAKQINKNLKLVVMNVTDKSTLYTYNPQNRQFTSEPKMESEITVGTQRWRISMYAPEDFGVSGLTRLLPDLILIGGGLLAALAFAFLMSQMRQRDQALKLADNMTEDLQNERNEAVIARQKDEAILASIGDAVFAIDNEGKILLFNPSAEAISGFTSQEAIGKPYKDILHFIFEKDRKLNDTFIKSALSGHLAQMKNHTKLIRKDGSEIYVADSAAPIRDHADGVIGAIVVFRDVSKELVLEQAKSEFVSLASHQLRTPLSAINWYSEMLLNGDAGKINKDQEEYMREIFDGNQRMIELVDSLLNVSRLEVGKLKNDPQHVSMIDLADSLQKEMQTSITAKKLVIERHLAEDLPTIYADPKLLRMIVQNILSNAIKYTPVAGKVTITMREATHSEITTAKLRPGQPYCFMSVSDTGFGIPKAQQSKIFAKLFRADNVRKLDVEGTGLGLYIVKEVTHKFGGNIWFESVESLGTTFYVVIPFKTNPS